MKSSIPQIALTGSSGFLGQYVLHSLIHDPLLPLDDQQPQPQPSQDSPGLLVHALYGGGVAEFPQAVQSIVQQCHSKKTTVQVKVHKLDLTDDSSVQAWIDHYAPHIDLCIHTAALSVPRQCQADPAKAQALNVPTTFLQGLATHKVHMIALSTDQVYDGTQTPSSTGPFYQETSPVNPLNVYGKTKVELEDFLKSMFDTQSMQCVILRSSIILGPKAPILGDKAHDTFLQFCQTRQNHETTFFTDECRSVIAADNVVQVIRWFCRQLLLLSTTTTTTTTKLAGVYNMGGPERTSRMDMAQAVFAHFGYATDKLIATEKASLPPQEVQSPLDITMDCSKLYGLIKDEIQWKGLKDIVSWTFKDW